MNWSNAPDFEEVRQTHIQVGLLRARIKALQKEIELDTLDIKKNNPRKPYLIVEATEDKQRELNKMECELEEMQAKLDFLVYWKDLFKQVSYNNGRTL